MFYLITNCLWSKCAWVSSFLLTWSYSCPLWKKEFWKSTQGEQPSKDFKSGASFRPARFATRTTPRPLLWPRWLPGEGMTGAPRCPLWWVVLTGLSATPISGIIVFIFLLRPKRSVGSSYFTVYMDFEPPLISLNIDYWYMVHGRKNVWFHVGI